MSYFTICELDAKSLSEDVEIRLVPGVNMTMVFFKMKAGAEIPKHSHPHEQMGTVLKGVIDLTIADVQKTVNEGDAYHIAPNVSHRGIAQTEAEVIEVFSPPREDL